jgi:DNA-binding GntR family transcriptional regulator
LGQAVEEHEEILEALGARDGRRLGKILRRHLANKFETVKDALAAQRQDGVRMDFTLA